MIICINCGKPNSPLMSCIQCGHPLPVEDPGCNRPGSEYADVLQGWLRKLRSRQTLWSDYASWFHSFALRFQERLLDAEQTLASLGPAVGLLGQSASVAVRDCRAGLNSLARAIDSQNFEAAEAASRRLAQGIRGLGGLLPDLDEGDAAGVRV